MNILQINSEPCLSAHDEDGVFVVAAYAGASTEAEISAILTVDSLSSGAEPEGLASCGASCSATISDQKLNRLPRFPFGE